MPHCESAEIIFTLLIGSFTLALAWLTVRENFLPRK